MRLLLTDYHLESARLIRAMLEAGDSEFVIVDEGLERQVSADEMKMVYRKHIQAADELIKATGYHRRDDEVEELRSAIND